MEDSRGASRGRVEALERVSVHHATGQVCCHGGREGSEASIWTGRIRMISVYAHVLHFRGDEPR